MTPYEWIAIGAVLLYAACITYKNWIKRDKREFLEF